MRLRVLTLFSVLALTAAACGASTAAPAADSVSVSDAWSRQPAEGQKVGVAYAVVTNDGESDVRIVSASSTASGDVQLHETLMDDEGAMSMREVEDFVVPAGGTFTFEPGGPHIMMMDIDSASFPTSTVDVTVTFDDGTSRSFDAEVRTIDGQLIDDDDLDHDDEGHGDVEMDMGEDSMEDS